MFNIKTLASKTWVFVTATIIIAGSSSAMAFALNNNIPEGVSKGVAPYTAATKANIQNGASQTEPTTEYTVIDLSKRGLDSERKKALRDKLSKIKSMTPEQIEEKYNIILANMIPGEKDISAEQAAAYAAAILKKAYKVDFTGYTAEASFSRSTVPNSDTWTVAFHAPQETKSSKRYIAGVNSVNGTMLDASSYTLDYREENATDLDNPQWTNKAQEEVAKLMPENVSILSTKVVCATPETGVTVVCDLSDGSAYSVRLTGADRETASCVYFPTGYDGSLDYKPLPGNGVG